ncbi:uncharacterized protein LOC131151996 [Malania oleifera]|uniref:uncharacterized protein LOC131151996 n=1 Tax=Malania oleifera TaxID=397392 RepID=UPI0025AD9E66|nr:uncharacterized protein LOC131151996 [Malania oleifera]
MRMKRKEDEIPVDQIHEDISDFSLSSPPAKIRILDGHFPPITQGEREAGDPLVYQKGPVLPREELLSSSVVQPNASAADALPSCYNTEETALVLYNPASTPLFKNPSSPPFSVVLRSDLIPGLKDHIFGLGSQNSMNLMKDKKTEEMNDSMAIIPWVASEAAGVEQLTTSPSEMKEAEATEVEMMEIEDMSRDGCNEQSEDFNGMVGGGGGEGLQYCQQQLQRRTPQFFGSTFSSVTWSRNNSVQLTFLMVKNVIC